MLINWEKVLNLLLLATDLRLDMERRILEKWATEKKSPDNFPIFFKPERRFNTQHTISKMTFFADGRCEEQKQTKG